jgi:hypothetical protein
MDAAFKAQWIEALRSGNYVQGEGRLRMDAEPDLGVAHQYCCLGVACDLRTDVTWDGVGHAVVDGAIWEPYDENDRYLGDDERYVSGDDDSYYGGYTELPGVLLARLDLADDAEHTLIRMNDSGSSFEEIAKWIEENL